MEIDRLLEFAVAYAACGWAVQAQLKDIVDGNLEDINPNAVKEISQRFKGFNEDLDAAIDAAVKSQT